MLIRRRVKTLGGEDGRRAPSRAGIADFIRNAENKISTNGGGGRGSYYAKLDVDLEQLIANVGHYFAVRYTISNRREADRETAECGQQAQHFQ